MITKEKVLIIKLGHSETLDAEISKECSLGDVVRTTVLLNYFKRDGVDITWLCDEQAEPLLKGNNYIDRILPWCFDTYLQLKKEKFDIVINLEKGPGICAMSDEINAWQHYGFRFSDWKGRAEGHFHTEKVLEICDNPLKKDKNRMFWQQHLAKVIDKNWSVKDKYIMAKRDVKETYDIGLNWRIGKKWPEKEWEFKNWEMLKEELEKLGLLVSWQPVLDVKDYMDWVASCRILVTCDSLGMHLALAYEKQVVALFGPTTPHEVYFYDRGFPLIASDRKMSSITVQEVLTTIKEILETGRR